MSGLENSCMTWRQLSGYAIGAVTPKALVDGVEINCMPDMHGVARCRWTHYICRA